MGGWGGEGCRGGEDGGGGGGGCVGGGGRSEEGRGGAINRSARVRGGSGGGMEDVKDAADRWGHLREYEGGLSEIGCSIRADLAHSTGASSTEEGGADCERAEFGGRDNESVEASDVEPLTGGRRE